MIEQASSGSNGSLRHYRTFCYIYAGMVLVCIIVVERVSNYGKKHGEDKDSAHVVSPVPVLIGNYSDVFTAIPINDFK